MKSFLRKNKKSLIAISLVILLLISIGAYYYVNRETEEPNPPYIAAQEAYDNLNYALAVAKYKEAINQDPGLTDAYIQAANIYLLKNKRNDAIDILKKGVGFASDQGAIYSEIAEIRSREGKIDLALANASKALEHSNSTENRVREVNYLLLLGNFEEAGNKADKISGNDAYSNYIQAILAFSDIATCQDFIQKTITADDKKRYSNFGVTIEGLTNKDQKEHKIETMMQVAKATIDSGEPALALLILNAVKVENEYYEGSHIYKAYVFIQYALYDQSISSLAEAKKYASNDPYIYQLLAETYYQKGDYPEADRNIQKSLSLGEARQDTRELAVDIYEANGNYADAISQIDILLGKFPNKYQYVYSKSHILLSSGKYPEADSLIERTILANMDNYSNQQTSVLYAIQARAVYMTEDKARAKELHTKSETVFSQNAETQYYYGLFYHDQEDKTSAGKYFDKAISLDTSGWITTEINSLNLSS